MDPITAFVIATLMMLLNGGILGLIHRDLPEGLRPAAFSWRLGTLLVAGGCVLLAVQHALPPGFVLPLANALLMLGLTAYWRALRQFDGLPESLHLLWPAFIGSLGIGWFSAVRPDLAARVMFASVTWLVLFIACARVLHRGGGSDPARSRRALLGLFLFLALFMLLRGGYFAVAAHSVADILDGRSWMNMATPLVAAILPVIGTTAFLLMCSERIRRQWEHAALTDALTGLANRRTLTRVGSERLSRALTEQRAFALAVVDVDHFKSINDRYGHDVGDIALRHVADTLASSASPGTLPGRQGGEEFVVLLDADPARAQQEAEQLRNAIRDARFRAGEHELQITVSIGITHCTATDRHLDDLLRRADQALYAAKSGGRDRVVAA
jgi:diguanylate cyclase (GGDEF)-like protein